MFHLSILMYYVRPKVFKSTFPLYVKISQLSYYKTRRKIKEKQWKCFGPKRKYKTKMDIMNHGRKYETMITKAFTIWICSIKCAIATENFIVIYLNVKFAVYVNSKDKNMKCLKTKAKHLRFHRGRHSKVFSLLK